MFLCDVYKEYITFCIVKGLSVHTLRVYKQRLEYFLKWIGNIDVLSITPALITKYSLFLYDKNKENQYYNYDCKISRETIRSYLAQLRTFFFWTDSKGYTNLGDFVILPKRSKRLVNIYSDLEIQQIYECVNSSQSWLKNRNYALLSLFLDSGLRVSEACTLTLESLHFDKNVVLVHGKGDKDRYVPLGSLTKKYLRKYLQLCPERKSNFIFVSYFNEVLTPNAVENIFYKIRKKTGFKICAHKLRHNFATNWLIRQYQETGKADIYQLMLIMGHTDVKTTEIYVHMAQQIVLGMNNYSKLDSIQNVLPSPSE